VTPAAAKQALRRTRGMRGVRPAGARLLAGMCAGVLVACGGAVMQVAALDDMERVRAGTGTRDAAALAPEAYARAEQERRIALGEHAAGDDVGAVLHAQRAVAAYDHALTVVRLARATAELADAQKTLGDATTQVQGIEGSRQQLEREATALEERLRLSRERLLPASSAAASVAREEARRVAARSLALEARLLCDAARLVVADADGVADAEGELTKLQGRLALRPAPIDDAARLRARCLDVLTRARRASGDDAGASDALLTELSAAGGWDPVRDERGVVVTLHGVFQGQDVTHDASKKLNDLGRVAAAHPGFALQVVVHDALPPKTPDETDARRAGVAIQALVAGGAAAGRIRAELAATWAPLVDARDAREQTRNERLDVVFVASGK
jgi:hypothetical protein